MAGAGPSGFALKLAVAPDVSRSEGVSEAEREQLRQLALIANSDDQTALMLGLAHRIEQLEQALREIRTNSNRIDPGRASAIPPESTDSGGPVERTALDRAASASTVKSFAGPRVWWWGAAFLLALIAVMLARHLVRHRRQSTTHPSLAELGLAAPGARPAFDLPHNPSSATPAIGAVQPIRAKITPKSVPADRQTVTMAVPPQAAITLPAAGPSLWAFDAVDFELPVAATVPTPGDDGARTVLEQYVADRFSGTASARELLDNPAVMVDCARLYYFEDGDLGKALDLLWLGVTQRPDEQRLWLAGFAICHRERLVAQFEELARRFQSRFGTASPWSGIQRLGADREPENVLYHSRGAASAMSAQDLRALTDEWLGVELDMETNILAGEMRSSIVGWQSRPSVTIAATGLSHAH